MRLTNGQFSGSKKLRSFDWPHFSCTRAPLFKGSANLFFIFETLYFLDAEVSNFDWENEGSVSPVRNQGIVYNFKIKK